MVKELLKKHNLPSVDELMKEIDTSELDEKDNSLKLICDRLAGKLEHFSGILELLIQPDSNFSNVHEFSIFSEKEKKEIMSDYKKIMFLHRRYLEVTLDSDEDNCAAFIKEFWNQWQELKKDLRSILEKMKNAWNGDTDKLRIELGYLG